MKLTEHFDLIEFTRSATAEANGIDNSLNPDNPQHRAIIENLRNLCVQVLEPLREFVGGPVIISSGYRCKELNDLVEGSKTSQHMTGEAVDIVIGEVSDVYPSETHGRASLQDIAVGLPVGTNMICESHGRASLQDIAVGLPVGTNMICESHGRASQEYTVCASQQKLKDCFLFIQNNCCFDQLILESRNYKRWIHVSCLRDIEKNRMMSRTMKIGG